ncbi:MAG: winged helix-turn-helix domain-containing protein [Burkholderiales bacterium]|nr:winged helix-turn-helix domain-containing protein [Burkholderiales bacterium]
MTAYYQYRFGTSTLDEFNHELIINGLAVDIQPQSFRILRTLLSHCGEIVSRAELEEIVWQGRPVGENVLASAITRLRSTLGETHAGLIEAIPRIGYRIASPVQRTALKPDSASKLELVAGEDAPERPHFVLESMLGQSPAGEVWLARQRKTGALRVYKYATDAGRLASLKREATLSRLLYEQLGERSDMIRILDWNFESAPFFLESEYGGDNLLNWSRSGERLSTLSREARIELFLQAARAVAAAHSVAVIHKDLKPANILVDACPTGWQLRLADFGSGRLMDDERLSALGITNMGLGGPQTLMSDAALGTAMYLAPEILREQPSTERSDIYALGIMLYQMLVGDLSHPMVPGWERDIDDPLLVEAIAQATDGTPTRRTASVADLIAQLDNLPARRDARAREAAEQAQREHDRREAHLARARRPWLLATLGMLALGLCISLFAFLQLRRDALAQSRQSQNIEALNQFLTQNLIGEANPSQTGRTNVTVQEAAQLAASQIDSPRLAYQPEIRASLHAAMQRTFDGLGNYQDAITEGQKAMAALSQQPGHDPSLLDSVRIMYADSLQNLTQIDAATAELDRVATTLRPEQAPPSETLGEYWFVRGRIAALHYQWADAQHDQTMAANITRQLTAPHSHLLNLVEYHRARAAMMLNDFPAAERISRALHDANNARYGQDHYLSCMATLALGEVLAYERRTRESLALTQSAQDCIQHATGPNSVATARALTKLARAYELGRDWDNAYATEMQAIVRLDQVLGPNANESIVARNNAGWDLKQAGHLNEASAMFSQVLAHAKATYPDSHPTIQSIRFNLADCLLDMEETTGVAQLLAGVNVRDLAAIRSELTWEGPFAYEQGRLALMTGNMQAAVSLLQRAEQEAVTHPDNALIPLARVQRYLAEARVRGR